MGCVYVASAQAAPVLTPHTESHAAMHSGHFGSSRTAAACSASHELASPGTRCRRGSVLVMALEPGHGVLERVLVATFWQ